MESTKSSGYHLLVTILSFVVVLIFVVLGVFALYSFSGNIKVESHVPSNTFVLSRFNPETNITVQSFVEVKRKLKSEEFLTYRNGNGEFDVISNVNAFDKEYECYGSCYCRSDDSRRQAAVFGSSLYFVIAALSTAMAVNVARNYFEPECVEKFKDLCDPKKVDSDVDFCAKIVYPHAKRPEKTLNTYRCKGHCVINQFLRKKEEIEIAMGYGCMKFKTEGVVKQACVSAAINSDEYVLVQKQFDELFLTPYCQKVSRFDKSRKVKDGIYEIYKSETFPLCGGSLPGITFQKNIKCFLKSYY